MDSKRTSYFTAEQTRTGHDAYGAALERCVERHKALLPVAGLRNPRIGGARWRQPLAVVHGL